jgi:hypothetical protein
MQRIIIPIAALALCGCGGDPKPLSMAATAESSRAALVAALDGWKAGKTAEELAAQSPPVRLIDDDFHGGMKLLNYKIETEGHVRGIGYSYIVTLTLEAKDGAKPTTKKIPYNAVTEPKYVVSREDRKV